MTPLFARLSHRLGVRRLSVTLVSCIKTVQARITKSLPWSASRFLVFRDKISCPWVRGSPRTKASMRDTPSKRRYFDPIGSSSVKTVAARYTHVTYHNKHWWQAFQIYPHRWPWMTLNPQNRRFSNFFAVSGCDTHFNTELRRNGLR